MLATGSYSKEQSSPYIQLLLQAGQQKLVIVLQAEQRQSNQDQLQAEQQGSIHLAIGGAADISSAIGEAAKVKYSTAVGTSSNARDTLQRSSSSTVPASDSRQQAYQCYHWLINHKRISAIIQLIRLQAYQHSRYLFRVAVQCKRQGYIRGKAPPYIQLLL